tara:strand:+ start:1352 stop:2245 length:894 start_codon:yes stop_codon:yes gene_type:complete
MANFSGVGVAIVTPFNNDGTVDYKGFENVINHIIKGGVNYIVVQGTTGESATLTKKEKQAVLDFAVETIAGRVPVVFGHGGNYTDSLLEGFKSLNLEKVDAILSASPYYNKPTQEGIYQHYKALAEASPKPIILYNVPGRTGSNVAPETTIRLAKEFKNIIAIKDASGSLDQMGYLVKHKPQGFLVLSGDDNLIVPQVAVGADGVISVIANALPARFSKMVHAALNGDAETAREYYKLLYDIIPLLFKDGNPGGVKAVLKMMGVLQSDAVRLPLVPVSKATYDELYRAVSEAGVTLE